MNVVLLSTYELGRQPFGLASPAAWLRREGAQVTCVDLSRQRLPEGAIRGADLVAFYVPMHTATRLAAPAAAATRRINPGAHLCFYGLYAPLNQAYLRSLGAETILGGEFETGLVNLLRRLKAAGRDRRTGPQPEPLVSLARQKFLVPDRTTLLPLADYAQLEVGGRHRLVGYTEASRGCKHRCRHCPVVPVYQGRFRIVQAEVVLADIRQQVAAGAEHITFGDPDFFNGIGHALFLVKALHCEFPWLTYDVTAKIEHLLQHSRHLETLRDTGCVFVTSAVESVDDRVLALLDKGHTRRDFVEVAGRFREVGLGLVPTFIPFTPWITLEGYLDLLDLLDNLGLVAQVAPIQLAIRLLLPSGSRLLELREVQEMVGEFDKKALHYRWRHADPRVDALQREVMALVQQGTREKADRAEIFTRIWGCACAVAGTRRHRPASFEGAPPRAAVPYLNEPWYC